MNTSLKLLRLEHEAALADHVAAWDKLAARLPQTQPMLLPAWFLSYVEHKLTPGESWVVHLAYLDGELAGVLPIVLSGRWPRRYARVPCDYHTENGDLPLDPTTAAQVLPVLLSTALEHEKGVRWISLSGIRDDSPTLPALESLTSRWHVHRAAEVVGSSIPLSGSPEAWRAQISKNLRSDMRRKVNAAARDGLGEPEIRFDGGEDADPAFLEEVMRIEASGWKGRDDVAISSKAGSRRKYEALAQHLAEVGRLEWHTLRYGGRLAAAHMAVRMDPGLMLLRQAYEDELKGYTPGNLLLEAMIVRELEAGTGGEMNLVTDYDWCRRWRMVQRPYVSARIVPRGFVSWLVADLPLQLRALAKRVLRRRPE